MMEGKEVTHMWRDDINKLIDAMVVAEGGPEAFIRAVQCSLPATKTYPDARQIAFNTIVHAMWDLLIPEQADNLTTFLGSRWAPIGAANDPKGLNFNWVKNVRNAWRMK